MTGATGIANDPTVLEREELDGLVHSEVARLPQRYRDCLILCDLEGCTYEQASQTLELPLGTVQSRLARTRKRLHDRFTRIGLHPWQPGRTGDCIAIGLPILQGRPANSLFRMTTVNCLHGTTGETAGLKFVSGSIAKLVHKASRSTIVSRAMLTGLALFPVVLLTGLAVYSRGPSPPQSASNRPACDTQPAVTESSINRLRHR